MVTQKLPDRAELLRNSEEVSEIELIEDLTVSLTYEMDKPYAEINAYQRVAGEAIFEIGRRLKHVKENDLNPRGFRQVARVVGDGRAAAANKGKARTRRVRVFYVNNYAKNSPL